MNAQAIRLTEVDIDNALANDHLGVVFQPVFSFEDGGLTRMEAFVRWDHPGLGSLPPGAFVSFFEAQGRMGELTRHVVSRAVRGYKAWRGAAGPGCSVNLAQSDLTDEAFPDALEALLAEEGLPAELVTLECPPLPDGTAPAEARTIYARLAATGCPLAAEVRGPVPEALMAADPFPFAEIKTGGSAILRFARTAKGGEALDAIQRLLDLAKTHGAKTVAVGIEDGDAALALKALGFDAGQGKLLGGAGDLSAFSAQSINGARAALGMEALSQGALAGMVERKAPSARDAAPEPDPTPGPPEPTPGAEAPAAVAHDTGPLVLTSPEPSSPNEAAARDDAPAAPAQEDATTVAIARLKARKIAAKRIALRRAEEARRRAEEESAAARQASETARRLQERLAAQIAQADEAPAYPTRTAPTTPPAPTGSAATDASDIEPLDAGADPAADLPAARAVVVSEPVETAPAGAAEAGSDQTVAADDEEAGLLLSDGLAEAALGIAKRPGFADGIRLDGYAPTGSDAAEGTDAALMGAFAPTQEPGVREGTVEPVAFTSMASAIHAILEDLPVPEDARPRLLRSATKPLDAAAADEGALDAGETTSAPAANPAHDLTQNSAPDLAHDLAEADILDAVVAETPILDDDTVSAVPDATGSPGEAALAARLRTRPRRRTNLLTRRYRITHFWPRSWVRAYRRLTAGSAARPRASDAPSPQAA